LLFALRMTGKEMTKMSIEGNVNLYSAVWLAAEINPHAGAAWTFAMGAWVTHKNQPLPSLVLGRTRSSKGREIYGIRSFLWEDENRDRMILADSLELMGPDHPDWELCLAHRTGLVDYA
jgi:hypothetical protein